LDSYFLSPSYYLSTFTHKFWTYKKCFLYFLYSTRSKRLLLYSLWLEIILLTLEILLTQKNKYCKNQLQKLPFRKLSFKKKQKMITRRIDTTLFDTTLLLSEQGLKNLTHELTNSLALLKERDWLDLWKNKRWKKVIKTNFTYLAFWKYLLLEINFEHFQFWILIFDMNVVAFCVMKIL